MAMNAVSFFLRRTRSSQKDARLQKLFALCLSFVGEEKERIFGCVFLGCKISVLDPPRRSVFSLFFLIPSSREVGIK